MYDFKEIGAVWRGEVTRSLKSGRIVALLVLYLVFTVLALGVAGAFNLKINEQFSGDQLAASGLNTEQAQEALQAQKKQFLDVVYDEPMLTALLPLPVSLLFVFKLAMLFVPLFVALMGFDQVSGEVGPKSIRYYVVRVRRSSLVAGKFLSQATLYAWLVSTCVVLMAAVAKALNADFSLAQTASWGLKLVVAAIVFGLAYLGLTALCSSLVRTSAISLILNVTALFVLWVLNFVGEGFFLLPGETVAAGSFSSLFKSESAFGYVRYLSIWHFESDLLHPEFLSALPALAAHVGFAMLCVGAAMVVLQRRDV